MTTLEKFLNQISVDENDELHCWVWTGACQTDGYGTLWDLELRKPDGKPTKLLAHRWAYDYYVGPIPKGEKVCHKCDNPPCVNPDHLFTGTQKDNVRDCIDKGRRAINDRSVNPEAKLTYEQVEEIRCRYTGKRGEQTWLGKEYGVTQSTVSAIVGGRERKNCS